MITQENIHPAGGICIKRYSRKYIFRAIVNDIVFNFAGFQCNHENRYMHSRSL